MQITKSIIELDINIEGNVMKTHHKRIARRHPTRASQQCFPLYRYSLPCPMQNKTILDTFVHVPTRQQLASICKYKTCIHQSKCT